MFLDKFNETQNCYYYKASSRRKQITIPFIFMGEGLNYWKFIDLWQEELKILKIFH